MIRLVILALVLSGCSAAQQERLASASLQWKEDKVPTIREFFLERVDNFTVLKRVIITNPYPYGINVLLKCSSIYQPQEVLHIAAQRERYQFVMVPIGMSHVKSCIIASYEKSELRLE